MSDTKPTAHHEQPADRSRPPADMAALSTILGDQLQSAISLSPLVDHLLSTAVRTVDAEGGSLLVLEEGHPSHWFMWQRGGVRSLPLPRARSLLERGIVRHVIRQRRGEWLQDLTGDPRWWDAFIAHLPSPPTSPLVQGSALCMPLIAYRRVVAVLMLVHSRPGHIGPQHMALLAENAAQAATAIEVARLYEAVRRGAEQMAALYDGALNLAADQPLDRLLDALVAQTMELLHCSGGAVYLWREAEGHLELVAMFDPEIDLRGTCVSPGEGLVGQVFAQGDLLAVEESLDWDASAAPSDLNIGLPVPTALAVPLAWQGRFLGVLVATDRAPERHFDHDDRRLLTLLANQAAAAIASVQLHEQTHRKLQELTFLNETIRDITATLDLDQIFSVLTARIKDLLGIEACSIALVDRETGDLVFRAASGGGAKTVVGERVPWGEGIAGAAAKLARPVNVPDVQRDERFYSKIDEKQPSFVTHSILAVPMISRGRVVGVVEGLNKAGGFDREDERLLSALANLAASVVENADLVAAQRQLEQLRENLTNMIIHDLRSPMGTILNSLQMLKQALSDQQAEQHDHLIELASRAARRVLNLVESLLDVSRLEAGHDLVQREPVFLPDLIQSAAEQMALYRTRKRIRLEMDWPEAVPVVTADREMIERVLVNLLDNAFKFTPSGGQVSIQVVPSQDALLVRVRDTGPGIPPEHRDHIFEKFTYVRAQSGVRGSGLGLAFCRLAVEAHGGRIWLENGEGDGASFVFTLPLT